MYNELTQVDIDKMQAEIDYREITLRPQLLAEVERTRAFGDLSENFEYKAAKQDKNRNESRIRYLKRMISTAKIITVESRPDEVGLFDTITIYTEEDDFEEQIRFVTTARQDALHGLISKEAPLAKALLGHHQGDRVQVEVEGADPYWVVIRKIEKGSDDASLEIRKY